jgi:hypothetical protein
MSQRFTAEDAETAINAEIAEITERFGVAPRSGGDRTRRFQNTNQMGFGPVRILDLLVLPPGPALVLPAGWVESIRHSAISVLSALIVVSVSSVPL